MFVRTERLLLRPAWPEDLGELRELLSAEYLDASLDPALLSQLDSELEAFVMRPHEPLYPHFLITLLDSGKTRPIGNASLRQAGDAVELGYWIARPFRGSGYGEEAVLAILEHARSLGHRRIEAWHFNENEASGKVLQHCGFEPTGKQRDQYNSMLKFVMPADVYAADLAKLPARQVVTPTQQQTASD